MSIFDGFLSSIGLKKPPTSANQAKERLQVVVSHQRRHRKSPDYLPMLEKDIMAVINKYVAVDDDMVDIKFHRTNNTSTLEVNVELPPENEVKARRAAAQADDDEAKPARKVSVASTSVKSDSVSTNIKQPSNDALRAKLEAAGLTARAAKTTVD
jgi:cell division topological specificity factor